MKMRGSLIAMALVLFMGGAADAQTLAPAPPAAGEAAPDRPALLIPLYLSNVGLNAADLYTTKVALNAGHREANPILKDASFTTMIAAKAATTTVSILLAEKLWHRNRFAAIGMMVATNVGMAVVVAHNYRVTNRR